MSEFLFQKISQTQSRAAAVAAAEGAVLPLASFVSLLTLTTLLDIWLDLPWLFRAVLLAANITLTLYLLTRYLILPLIHAPDDESIALAVEHLHPHFSSRLIAAIQFSDPAALSPGESPALVRAMITQTESLAEQTDFTKIVQFRRLQKWSLFAGVALLLSLTLYAVGGSWSPILLQRAFLSTTHLPSKTQIEVLSGDFALVRGESAILTARAHGLQPDAGQAQITYNDSGTTQTLLLTRSPEDPSLYSATLDAIQEPFNYTIRLNDAQSDPYTVKLETRPNIESLTFTQLYPAYTNLPPQPRQPADLSLLLGSKLRINLTANKPLRAPAFPSPPALSRILFTPKDNTPAIPPITMELNSTNPAQLSAEIPLPPNLAGFSIQLVDAAGIESKNPVFYPVELLPDRPPTIRITSPEQSETLVTAESTTDVGFLAEDDYALAALTLKYHINDGPEKSIPLALPPKQKTFRGFYPWPISRIDPPPDSATLEGSTIEFYIEARDANTLTGPGITFTDHYQLRVVSKSEKQAELLGRLNESFNTIRDLSETQEKASSELGALVTQQPPTSQPRPSRSDPAAPGP